MGGGGEARGGGEVGGEAGMLFLLNHGAFPWRGLRFVTAPCQQEWTRLDTILKLARAGIYMKGRYHEIKDGDNKELFVNARDRKFPPSVPGAKEYQVLGRCVVGRLLCGRIASVLQCYLSLKMLGVFNPRIFESHVRAAKNFEEHLAGVGPEGPLEWGNAAAGGDGNGASSEARTEDDDLTPEELADLDARFEKWATKREEAVFKQQKLISELIAEACVHALPRDEAKMLLEAAREIYKGECQDAPTLARCLRTFDTTEDMI